jgi:hypothetical protein
MRCGVTSVVLSLGRPHYTHLSQDRELGCAMSGVAGQRRAPRRLNAGGGWGGGRASHTRPG